MKNIYKYILLSLSFLFINCDKEVEINDVSQFEFEATYNPVISINRNEPTTFKILSDFDVNDAVYSFKYTMIQGKGEFYIDNDLIPENEFIELENLETTLQFLSNELGSAIAKVEIRNNSGIFKTKDLKYTISPSFLDFTLTTNESIDSSMKSNINLDLVGEAENVYKISYNITPANGSSLKRDDIILTQNSVINIGPNIFNFDFAAVGDYTIEFIVQNNFSETVTKTIPVSIKHSPFTAEIVAQNDIVAETPSLINLNITTTSTNSYRLVSYSISNSMVTLKNNDNTTIAASQPITLVNSFLVLSNQVEPFDITMIIEDNFNQSFTITKTITPKFPNSLFKNTTYQEHREDISRNCEFKLSVKTFNNSNYLDVQEIQYFNSFNTSLRTKTETIRNGESYNLVWGFSCKTNIKHSFNDNTQSCFSYNNANTPTHVKVRVGTIWSDFIPIQL